MSFTPSELERLRENQRRAQGLPPVGKPRGGQPGAGKPTFTRSKPADRTYAGVTYASKGEMEFAKGLLIERGSGRSLWWVRQPVFDVAGVKYSPDFLVVRCPGKAVLGTGELFFGNVRTTVTVYEIKPRLNPGLPGSRQRRFRDEALRRFKRNAAQVSALWGVEVELIEI